MSQSVTENYSGKRKRYNAIRSDRVLLIDIPPPVSEDMLSGVTKPLNTAAVGFTEKPSRNGYNEYRKRLANNTMHVSRRTTVL